MNRESALDDGWSVCDCQTCGFVAVGRVATQHNPLCREYGDLLTLGKRAYPRNNYLSADSVVGRRREMTDGSKPEQHALAVYKCLHRALAEAVDLIQVRESELKPGDEEAADALNALFDVWRETAGLFQGRMREEFPRLWESAEIERLIEETRRPHRE